MERIKQWSLRGGRRLVRQFGQEARAPKKPSRIGRALGATAVISGSLVAADAQFYSDALGLRKAWFGGHSDAENGAQLKRPAEVKAALPQASPAAPVKEVFENSVALQAAEKAETVEKEEKAAEKVAKAAAEAAAAEAAAAEAAAAKCLEAQHLIQDALQQDLYQAILEPSQLLSALHAAEALISELSADWKEKSQPSFQEARGRLKAAAAAKNWRQAEKELQMQLEADADLVSLQAALEALTEAHSQLLEEGIELARLGFEADLRGKGQMQLVLLHATKKREEAMSTLRSALASRYQVSEAFDAAKAAGIETELPQMRLAEALSRPLELCALMEEGSVAVGLVVEDFARAKEAMAASFADLNELEEECARLAESLASAQEMQLEYGRRSLRESLEFLRERSYARAVKDFHLAYDLRLDALKRRQLRSVEESTAHVEKVLAQARTRFAAERDGKLEALRQDLSLALATICQGDLQETQHRLEQTQGPLDILEAARGECTSQGKVSLSAKLLSAAVEAPPRSSLEALEAESGFAATLLKDLEVEEAPSVSEIRRNFSSLLLQLAAVALAPPADSLLGRLVSEALGSALAKVYELAAFAAPAEAGSTEVERNLATLTAAFKRLEADDVYGAVTALEGLTGDCERRAGSWLRQARQALLWQQTFAALQAKARCLNAA